MYDCCWRSQGQPFKEVWMRGTWYIDICTQLDGGPFSVEGLIHGVPFVGHIKSRDLCKNTSHTFRIYILLIKWSQYCLPTSYVCLVWIIKWYTYESSVQFLSKSKHKRLMDNERGSKIRCSHLRERVGKFFPYLVVPHLTLLFLGALMEYARDPEGLILEPGWERMCRLWCTTILVHHTMFLGCCYPISRPSTIYVGSTVFELTPQTWINSSR